MVGVVHWWLGNILGNFGNLEGKRLRCMGANSCNAKPQGLRSFGCIWEISGCIEIQPFEQTMQPCGFQPPLLYIFLWEFWLHQFLWQCLWFRATADPAHFGHFKLKVSWIELSLAWIQKVIHLLQNHSITFHGENQLPRLRGRNSSFCGKTVVPVCRFRWATNQSSWKNLEALELFQPATRRWCGAFGVEGIMNLL